MLVLRKEMDSTVPSMLLHAIQSPTVKGLSTRITMPAKMLERESLAAREKAKPPIDKPAIKPLMSKPHTLTTEAKHRQITRA